MYYLFSMFVIGLSAEVVLTSTHNVCFGSKIRNFFIPLKPQFFYIKVGFNWGIHFSDMFS